MKKIIILSLAFLCTIYSGLSQIGIGTTSPNSSAILDVFSTSKGLLFPRMTNAQRNAIVDATESLTIYNLDEKSLQINLGTASSPRWINICSSSSATVTNNCNVNGFEGTYTNGVALMGSNTFSVTITNNSFNDIDINFNISDLVLDGISGISVSSVNPTSSTIVSGNSLLIEYSLTGTPTSTGILTGIWTKLGLNCITTVNVEDALSGDATFLLPEMVIAASIYAVSPSGDDETNFQGIIDNNLNKLTINIPYTSGFGTYDAYAGTYILNNSGTGEGGDINSFRLTYPAGTFSTSGRITATIEVDGDGSFNVKKQPYNSQEVIANLDFKVNGNSKGFIHVDAFGGITDRNFNNADHKFIYLPVATADGKVWLNNNLGAQYANINRAQFNPNLQATAYNDYFAYGSLFQWGRYSDGHELMVYSSSTSGIPTNITSSNSYSTTTTPNNTIFYLANENPAETQNYNWLDLGASPNAIEDGLWQGETGPNNPCPNGYRIPENSELVSLFSAEGITNYYTAANSPIALSAGGNRSGSTEILNEADFGIYWSSTINDSIANYSLISESSTSSGTFSRATAFGVRCIKN